MYVSVFDVCVCECCCVYLWSVSYVDLQAEVEEMEGAGVFLCVYDVCVCALLSCVDTREQAQDLSVIIC